MKKIFIIAEAGVNHNGSVDKALRLIDAAKESGADAVKFQTFKAEDSISRFAPKAEYQRKTTSKKQSQLEMVKKLELSDSDHKRILSYCKKKKIEFISSPFDLKSVELLKKLNIRKIKIASGEITNLPLLEAIGTLRRQVILSTGMSTIYEIREALGVLNRAGTRKECIKLLHCNTEYPSPFEDINLKAMITMKNIFKTDVGYSDHTIGFEAAIAASALGAAIIEKHLTLDKNMPGPDHKSSINPREFKKMVFAIRNVEKVLGNGVKKPSKSEMKNIMIVRKSIVAAKDIKKGEPYSPQNLTVKRPGTGLSPMTWPCVIGKIAKKSFKKDRQISI